LLNPRSLRPRRSWPLKEGVTLAALFVLSLLFLGFFLGGGQ
jgi:hypothetical protein